MSHTTFASFRARFPLLARRVYVNSCSQGALSLDVEEANQRFVETWHRDGSPWDAWVAEVERLRDVVAAAIGASPDEVAIAPSASVAVSALASALDFSGPRRKVVVGSFEFPTMGHVWLAQARRGADILWVDGDGARLPVSEYVAAIDDRTLVVPATHVCYRNGYRIDVPALTAACHAHGAYVLLDDYQRTGTAPLDVHALGVDFLVTGALKYLLGAAGIAFLYVRRDLIDRFEPAVTGWFGRVDPFAFRPDVLDWSPTSRRFEAGTPSVPSAYMARAGIELLASLGWEAIDNRIDELTARLLQGLHQGGFACLTPDVRAERGPLTVVHSTDPAALLERLSARGIVASTRGQGLRIALHAYNTEEDVDVVLDALDEERALLVQAPAAV